MNSPCQPTSLPWGFRYSTILPGVSFCLASVWPNSREFHSEPSALSSHLITPSSQQATHFPRVLDPSYMSVVLTLTPLVQISVLSLPVSIPSPTYHSPPRLHRYRLISPFTHPLPPSSSSPQQGGKAASSSPSPLIFSFP